MKRKTRSLLMCLVVGFVSLSLVGQNSDKQASASSTSDNSQKLDEKQILKKEQSQRILGVYPQFAVTSRHDAPPLTASQKFKLAAKTAVDPFTFVAAGLQAGIGQATNSHDEYGQGAAGYGKRYGAALADSETSNFFANFAYPVLFKADPRYFRLGEGSFKHRFFYSISQEFTCHTDKGKRSFNFSNVLGAFTSGGISNAYYPPEDRGFGLTMSTSAISLIWGSVGGIINEFWPDLDRKISHKKPKDATSAPAPH